MAAGVLAIVVLLVIPMGTAPASPRLLHLPSISLSRGVETFVPVPVDHLRIQKFVELPGGSFLGEWLQLVSRVSGGVLPYVYTYAGLPPGCAGQSTGNLTCLPNATGSYSVVLQVNDSGGAKAASSLNVTILSPAPLEVVAVDFDRRNVTVGVPFRIHPEVLGGVGNLSYAYSVLPSGCTSSNSSMLLCVPTYPGVGTVQVHVRDVIGRTANGSRSLTVLPANLTIVSFAASPSAVVAGGTIDFTSVVSGAVGTLSYSYSGLPGGCRSIDSSDLVCSPGQPGDFGVQLTVRDGLGRTANGTASLHVANEPAPTIVSFTVTPPVARLGELVEISVDATGGLGWLTYNFTGLPSGCASSNSSYFSCIVNQSGSYDLSASVSDSNGEVSRASAGLLVSPSTQTYAPRSTPVFSPSPAGMVVLVALGVAALAGTIIYLRRRPR